MKVLADLHHDALYASLQLLFEKRLGWELYRPIGLEWYHEGFWHVFPHIDTAKQYLGLNQLVDWPKDVHGNKLHPQQCLNLNYRHEDGIYYVEDIPRKVYQRGITLDKFKSMEFDILLSSMPAHVEPFNKLIQQYQPKAKHVFQVGNNWPVGHLNVKNLLSSAKKINPRQDQHVVYYHQEFPLDVYSPGPCENPKSVINMMHHLPNPAKEIFLALEKMMPDWKFSFRGACNRDDAVLTEKIPETLRAHGFLFHVKPEGDGFGYNTHHAAAIGRPIITKKSHFKGMTVEPLLVHGKTCIDLDQVPLQNVPAFLEHMAVPVNHATYAKMTHEQFNDVVRFDHEFELIRRFLDTLK